MKLIKHIRWAFVKDEVEKNLARFCEIEYRPSERSEVLSRAISEHKAHFFGKR
jgi:hypothetical protein